MDDNIFWIITPARDNAWLPWSTKKANQHTTIFPLSRVFKDIVDEDKSSLGSDAYTMAVDKEYKGMLTFTNCGQKTYDPDNNFVPDSRYEDMSAEEKSECTKKFDFAVSNNLDQISFDGFSKKVVKKTLKTAFVKYAKNVVAAKFGEGKHPDKKAFKQALAADDGLLGKKGFVVAKILSDFKDMDFYCAAEKTGEAFNGDCAMVVCEWTGGATADFHLVHAGLKEEKYWVL